MLKYMVNRVTDRSSSSCMQYSTGRVILLKVQLYTN